ncbi:hypothetical protein B0H13DRAFT_2307264 [Mycena leptocephala]|nr:hypothetical protein B0H13DRAFT_2307264 [Mycena leptocephala]
MSLSRLLPGCTRENPLVLDANGHLVQIGTRPGDSFENPLQPDAAPVVAGERRPYPGIIEGPPSSIIAPASFRRANTTIRGARLAASDRHISRDDGENSAGARLAANDHDESESSTAAAEDRYRGIVDALDRIDVPGRDAIGRRLSTREHVALARRAPPPFEHSAARVGLRVRQGPPVTTESLYRTEGRPRDYDPSQDHHECAICMGVKDHPVSYVPPLF